MTLPEPSTLPVIWGFIIAFAIFAYVVMDGFDLGIGILFPGFAAGRERDSAMNSIAPVWDGNETWLVLGGGGLMAAFPLAYGIILSVNEKSTKNIKKTLIPICDREITI